MLIRKLRRDPVLIAAATATLAICIGANTTMFSLVNSILLKPLPYPGGDRLCWVTERMGRNNEMDVAVAPDYYSLREQGRVFEDVSAFDTLTLNWTGVERPEQLDAAQVTPSFFRVMGSQPLMGRYLAPGEEGSKAPTIAVVSYAFWRNRLGSDPGAVGKAIQLDRLPHTIVGVMPQGFDYPQGTQVWRPLPIDEASQRPRSARRPMRIVNILARLKPGVGEQQLATEMSRLTFAIRGEYPPEYESAGFLKNMAITAMPLQGRMTGDLKPALLVLTAAVGLVLLIACVNLANLLLARASARQRELAVRLALGADRWRIIRQMLAESVLLALPGGLAGMAIAGLAVWALNAAKPLVLVRYPAISVDVPTLLFTFGLTLGTGLVFGIAPALAAGRIDIQNSLKAAGQTQSLGPRIAGLRRILVVAELSVSLVLLVGAGLLSRSFLKLAGARLGFPADHLLTLRVNLTSSRYATAESQVQFFEDVLQRVRGLPMVRDAAVSTDVPLSGERQWNSTSFQVAGRPPLPASQRPSAAVTMVSRDFFRTMGIPLTAGRLFGPGDSPSSPDNIVVNEAFARKIFPGEDPLGRRIVTGANDSQQFTIIGVAGSIRGNALGAEPAPLIYHCTCQGGNRFLSLMRLMVRTNQDPSAAIRAVEGQVYAVDRDQPVFDVKTMEQRLEDSLAPQRFQLVLIGTFAVLAILLAAAGVYGVMSYLVARRTREIGIRVALGARPEDIMRLVFSETAGLVLVAVAIGLGGAWVLTRYVKAMLYGVTALDGPTFAITPLVLAVTVLVASLGPARRAARVDPITALREE